jgi:hypothetical protein
MGVAACGSGGGIEEVVSTPGVEVSAVNKELGLGKPGPNLGVDYFSTTEPFAREWLKGIEEAADKTGCVEIVAITDDTVAGIRANAIAPWAIRTEMLSAMIAAHRAPARMELEMALLHPLERLGEPAEIAAGAAFLLGAESSFVSGQVIGFDGGAGARAFRFEPEPGLADARGEGR